MSQRAEARLWEFCYRNSKSPHWLEQQIEAGILAWDRALEWVQSQMRLFFILWCKERMVEYTDSSPLRQSYKDRSLKSKIWSYYMTEQFYASFSLPSFTPTFVDSYFYLQYLVNHWFLPFRFSIVFTFVLKFSATIPYSYCTIYQPSFIVRFLKRSSHHLHFHLIL